MPSSLKNHLQGQVQPKTIEPCNGRGILVSAAIWPRLKAGEKLHQIQLVEDPDGSVLLATSLSFYVLCGYGGYVDMDMLQKSN